MSKRFNWLCFGIAALFVVVMTTGYVQAECTNCTKVQSVITETTVQVDPTLSVVSYGSQGGYVAPSNGSSGGSYTSGVIYSTPRNARYDRRRDRIERRRDRWNTRRSTRWGLIGGGCRG